MNKEMSCLPLDWSDFTSLAEVQKVDCVGGGGIFLECLYFSVAFSVGVSFL